jgi:diguanylate cyclase (GGDEF)-like protein
VSHDDRSEPDGPTPDAAAVIDLSVVVDDDLRVVDISDAARFLGGLDRPGPLPPVADLVDERDLGRVLEALGQAHRVGVSEPVTFSFRDAAGRWRAVVAVAEDRRDDPRVGGTVLRFESTLSRPLSSILVEGVTRFTTEAILVLDRGWTVTDAGPGTRAVLGVDPADLIGRPASEVWTSTSDADRDLVRSRAAGVAAGPDGGSDVFRHRARTGSGGVEWVETRITNLFDDPLVRGLLVNSRVVHEEQEALLALRRRLERDPLTGLPNRLAVETWLSQAIADGAERWVVLLHVEGIAPINDTHGHQVGDQALLRVAGRIQRACAYRPLGRFEGNGFVVLTDPGEDPDTLVEALRDVVERPLDGVAVSGWRVGLVAGSCRVDGAPDPGELLRRADLALTAARAGGRAAHVRHDAGLDAVQTRRRVLGQQLRDALARGEFEMRFEPVVDLRDGGLVGCESLVRWRHPSQGVLAPGEFMQTMEEEGIQGELDVWVAEQVVLVAADWRRAGFDLQVGINVSGQGLDLGYPELLAELCDRHDVAPGTLSVELLESIRPRPELMPRIEALGALGVKLAIDDFGTGYSSLAALHRLRASSVKIDGVFVRGVEDDEGSRAIIEASVSVARAFGMRVVAEWVERESQRSALLDLDVDRGQGALFGPAVTAGEFERRHLRPATGP